MNRIFLGINNHSDLSVSVKYLSSSDKKFDTVLKNLQLSVCLSVWLTDVGLVAFLLCFIFSLPVIVPFLSLLLYFCIKNN